MQSTPAADRKGMLRAAELAVRALGHTSPNPVVGCCLVYRPGQPDERLLAEGFHRRAGDLHAEAAALSALSPEDRLLLPQATAYVTLEPCAHHGKTPPCADALVSAGIGRVVYGTVDPDPRVSGNGLRLLEAAGVVVEAAAPELQDWCRWINRRFLVSVVQQRPYLVLKWAQTPEGGMDAARTVEHPGPFPVSSPEAQVVVHRWRSEEDAILVGARTWDLDRPQLNARLVGGRAPRRLVLGTPSTPLPSDVTCFAAPEDALTWCNENGIRSVLVEGGASVLASFLQAGLWDELRVLTQGRPWTPSVWAPSLPDNAQCLNGPEQVKRGFTKRMGATECCVYLRSTDLTE